MENLLKLRKERKITTRQIADIFNVSKATYNNWETGKSEPNLEMLKSLSNFFGVSVDYLIGAESKRFFSTSNVDFTEEEKAIIKAYRELTFDQQKVIKVQLQVLVEQKI